MKVKNRPDNKKKGQKGKNTNGVKKTIQKGNSTNGSRKNARPKKGQWNNVPIGEEFFTDKEFENLITFEELHDYDVVTKEDGTKEILSYEVNAGKVVKENEVKKRKAEDVPQEETRPIAEKKSKKKKKLSSAALDEEEVINTSAGVVIIEEDESLAPSSGKTELSSANAKKKSSTENKKVKKARPTKWKNDVTEESSPEDVDNADFETEEWIKLGVSDVIMKALKEKKFNKPTSIQALTLPASILGKKDVVGAAETGSGKTLAFAIPIIDGILKSRKMMEEEEEDDDNALSALILTPTRELAVQIKNHFDVAAKYANIKTVVIVGGLAAQKQERLLLSKPDVVIATPGRLWELVQEGDPHLSTLHQVKFLAVDETDRMVEKGHFQELQSILQALNRDEEYKDKRQNFIFSATLSFTHEPPQRLKKLGIKNKLKQQPKKVSAKEKLKQIMEMVGLRPNPKIVDITTSKGTCETLTEAQITCSHDHKDYYLYYFLTMHPGRTIVFCNSINCVRRLTNLFFLLECGEVLPLHSEMHQKQRLRNLERFTANEKGILIATDVAARGLDIQNINHVVHYQVPKTAESYIHRSGRTARAFQGGLAVLMVEPGETTTVKNIFRSLGRDEMLPPFDVDGKVFRELKGTIEMAGKVETFEHQVRKKLADHSWMEKAKKDMDLASSSDDDSDNESGSARQKKSLLAAKKKLDNYKKQLSQMLISNNSYSQVQK